MDSLSDLHPRPRHLKLHVCVSLKGSSRDHKKIDTCVYIYIYIYTYLCFFCVWLNDFQYMDGLQG